MEISVSNIITIIVGLFSALGIGGIFGAYFQSIFQHKCEVKEREHELKRRRYSCMLILLLTKINPKVGLSKVRKIRSDLKELRDIEEEIETEMLNCILFASDDVMSSMSQFMHRSTYRNYVKVATAMRKDLWNKRTKITEKVLFIKK